MAIDTILLHHIVEAAKHVKLFFLVIYCVTLTEPAKARLQWLKKQLHDWSYHYYVLDAPIVSDAVFDQHFAELRLLEAQHPDWITVDSPSQQIGPKADVTFSPKAHKAPMRSLDNIFDVSALKQFFERLGRLLDTDTDTLWLTCEPKLDGLAINLGYVNGHLRYATTRGDGHIGENVTANIKTIATLPHCLNVHPIPAHLEVRAEVYMPIKAFAQLNANLKNEDKKTFANPRNAAAGSLRQLDAAITSKRQLALYCYGIGYCEGMTLADSHFAQLDWLQKAGFPVNEDRKHVQGMDACLAYHANMLRSRASLPFEIDGVVYKVDSIELQQKLGFNARAPRFACAHKYPAEIATSQLLGVDFQVGRTGALTPVAKLKPVLVGGVQIARATLHNLDDIARKGIAIGDVVSVRRAGDVIPEVVSLVAPATENERQQILMPSHCPVCDAKTTRIEGEAVGRCSGGFRCSAQLKRLLWHFASRAAMNIDGLGDGIIEQLVDRAMVGDVSELYVLTTQKLQSLERLGAKSAENLIRSLEKSKNTSLARFLFALGIRGVGQATAARLAISMGSLEKLIQGSVDDFMAIKDVGPIVAEQLQLFFSQEKNLKVIKALCQVGIKWPAPKPVNSNSAHPFAGKVLVITGGLHVFKRDEAKIALQALGAQVSSQISSKTDYLIVGDKPTIKKTQKATALKIPCLDEAAFVKMLK